MKKLLIILASIILIAISIVVHYWINTQPIAIIKTAPAKLSELPETNRKIIQFVTDQGRRIAPTYDTAVCTEFVIQIMEHFQSLTRDERKLIRIITDKNLVELIENNSAIIKGLQTALLLKNKGIPVERATDVLPGDFVQFWNIYGKSAYGHCGVVHTIESGKNITVYSSHPVTKGYGIQKFTWPDKVFFARMNNE